MDTIQIYGQADAQLLTLRRVGVIRNQRSKIRRMFMISNAGGGL